jgi:acyl-ACP thioesterase
VPSQSPAELVSPPTGGRVYEQSVRAGFADCAPSGRLRLDGLARWLQDVAYADVEDAGLAELAVWVVRRTRVRVRRFPRFGERHTLSTFCSGLGRMWGERRTTVRGEGQPEADVEAAAIWVHLDPRDWRPVPFSARELECYGAAAGDRRVSARLRHPPPPPGSAAARWSFRTTELDIAAHINNAAYWQPLEAELLAGPEPESLDAEIEFRTPSQPGEMLVLSDSSPLGEGARRWICELTGEASASLLVKELLVCNSGSGE